MNPSGSINAGIPFSMRSCGHAGFGFAPDVDSTGKNRWHLTPYGLPYGLSYGLSLQYPGNLTTLSGRNRNSEIVRGSTVKIEINRREVISTQKELSELIGCPGYEGEVGACLLAKIEPLTDKAWKDPLGNILAVKKGSGSNAERLLLSAHMDEVGFMVNHIEKDGFLRVDTLGRIDRRLLPGSLLQFRSTAGQPVIGVAGTAPPHITTAQEREQIPEIRDLFVDMGAGTEEEVLSRGIDVGSVGSFHSPFIELNEHRLLGKAAIRLVAAYSLL